MRYILTARGLIALTGAGSLALVGGGIVLAQTMNLAACPLCILQRMAYLLIAAEAILALGLLRSAILLRAAAMVMGATAGLGAWIAGYQTWLQRFAKGVSCTAEQPWWEHFVNWAGVQWPLMFEASGLCSEAGWRFLGLSIAEWSLVMFLSMISILLFAAFGRRAS